MAASEQFHSDRRLFGLRALAFLFASAVTLYSVLWIYQIHRGTIPVGVRALRFDPAHHFLEVEGPIIANSPAAIAGLQIGDHIVSVNGRALVTLLPFYEELVIAPNDVAVLAVERAGSAQQLHLELTRRSNDPELTRPYRIPRAIGLIITFYPAGFLVVLVAVLFLRVDSGDAWRLAILFAGIIAAAPLNEDAVPTRLRGFMIGFQILTSFLVSGMFYRFFATFPVRSPIDRKMPCLKHGAWAVPLVIALPYALITSIAGGSAPLYKHSQWPFASLLLLGQTIREGLPSLHSGRGYVLAAYLLLGLGLGLTCLVSSAVTIRDVQARRKARVILWGAALGTMPMILLSIFVFPRYTTDVPIVLWGLSVMFLETSMPLAFAYAVVKHRVLEIPVLMRRSARYLLVQRGFVLLHVAASIGLTLAFAYFPLRILRDTRLLSGPGQVVAAAAFGSLLAIAGIQIQRRVSRRIDRAFFRSAYDARRILENLAADSLKANSREQLATLLARDIALALRPAELGVYLEDHDQHLHLLCGHAGTASIAVSNPLLRNLQRSGELIEFDSERRTAETGKEVAFAFAPECLVPLLGRDQRLAGIVVLGSRLSEEPYSGEDKRLLRSVATQASIVLDGISLAEQIAEKMKQERETARELEFAREVQNRLFPQRRPALGSLDYAGTCEQAKRVGGDYYDFLDLGRGRLALVVADIAGKGVSAALLMANLQANLRSQYALALDDLPKLIRSVNALLFANTGDSKYATLFYCDYDDTSHELRYVNCGHPPPLILRHETGKIEKLESTCTVVGLFAEISFSVQSTVLDPGDRLLIYTDGVSEATNALSEEFGDRYLIETMSDSCELRACDLVDAVLNRVRKFTTGEQADDMTIIAACRT